MAWFLLTRKGHEHQPFVRQSMMRNTDLYPLLQIICTTLLLNNIKHWFATEPARYRCSNSLVCESCIIVIDFYSLVTSASSSGICHQLRVTAFLEADEPEYCGFNGVADRQ